MDIFLNHSYKDALKQRLADRKKQLGKRYSSEMLADHCQVQKSYLSRVFNGNAHLNQDQLFLACEYLGLNSDETNFLDLLHQKERSLIDSRVKKINLQIERIRQEHLNPDKRIEAERLNELNEALNVYYLDPFCQLTHMFLTIPQYAQSLQKIRKQLHLSAADMDRIINVLQKLQIVQFEDYKWTVIKSNLTLPRDSPLSKACNQLVRQQGLERSKFVQEQKMTRYNVFFTADEAAYKALSTEFLVFLEKAQAIVKPATAQQVFQLTFDLIPWSEGDA